MKKISTLLGLGLLLASNVHATDQSFNLTLKLYKPITITKIQDLLFPDTTLTGSAFDITVATTGSGAATFNAQGGKNRNITKSIVESSINMSAPGVTGSIAVNTFAISGPTAFDSSGNANGLKVGAVAHVLAASEDGNYTGTATFRVVYQ
ncbi:MAG: DUF4402 domain-containing protein [bacterium]